MGNHCRRSFWDYSSSFSSSIKQQWFHDYGGNRGDDKAEVEHQNCLEDLPEDIAKGMIFRRMSLPDRIRVGSVSKSCRALIKGVSPVPQLPWLLLPRDNLDSKQLGFFDMSMGKVHNYNLPSSLQGCEFCGSSKGWLVFTRRRKTICCHVNLFYPFKGSSGVLEIFLFNPILNVVHQLPSLSAPYWYFELCCQLTLVRLSSHDLRECVVGSVIDYSFFDDPKLAFCRPGLDKEWSFLDGQENHDYVDSLFWNGTLCVLRARTSEDEGFESLNFKFGGGCEVNINMIPCERNEPHLIFHFVDEDGNDIEIDVDIDDPVIDVGADHGNEEEGEDIIGVQDDDEEEDDDDKDDIGVAKNYLKDPYLVESTTGELLLIMKISDVFMNSVQFINNYSHGSDEDWDYVCRKTCGFEVYKMDPKSEEFRRIDDIEDQVIFLTLFGSQSCSARDFEGMRGNCIYFVEDTKHVGYEGSIAIAARESGVYHFDDRRIERCFPNVDSVTEDLMSWFTPYL